MKAGEAPPLASGASASYPPLHRVQHAPGGDSMREARELTGTGSWVTRIASMQDRESYSEQHWEGSFEEYLDLVRRNPKVTRTAFQRVYEMILSHGKTEYLDNKKKRVILLHGPVGSSKSTIARLLKKGIEAYSKTSEGALYTFAWDAERVNLDGQKRREVMPCPMNEEPLHLVPQEWRPQVYAELSPPESGFTIPDTGDLCPACRFVYKELMTEYKGDWQKVMSHVRVRRQILSEKDRVGIGTFQPKDEKNQDSTELTGDINYRK